MDTAALVGRTPHHMVGNAFVLVGKQLPADHTGNSPQLFVSKKIGVVLFIENHRGLY